MRDITPTQKPVPSNDIKDLLFNSGLLDKWATSLEHEYIDRFGSSHLTAAGMEWIFTTLVDKFKLDADAAIRAAGYVLLDSFQQGVKLPNNELTIRTQLLRDERTGEYYRWDGELPKTVLPGSTPQSTGGPVSPERPTGLWTGVGDAALRTAIKNGDGSLIGTMHRGALTTDLVAIDRRPDGYGDSIDSVLATGRDVELNRDLVTRGVVALDDYAVVRGAGGALNPSYIGSAFTATGKKGIRIHDLRTTGRVANGPVANGAAYALNFSGCSDLRIDGVNTSSYTGPVVLTDCMDSVIRDVFARSNRHHPDVAAGAYGVLLQGGKDILVDGINFEADAEKGDLGRHPIYISIKPGDPTVFCENVTVRGIISKKNGLKNRAMWDGVIRKSKNAKLTEFNCRGSNGGFSIFTEDGLVENPSICNGYLEIEQYDDNYVYAVDAYGRKSADEITGLSVSDVTIRLIDDNANSQYCRLIAINLRADDSTISNVRILAPSPTNVIHINGGDGVTIAGITDKLTRVEAEVSALIRFTADTKNVSLGGVTTKRPMFSGLGFVTDLTVDYMRRVTIINEAGVFSKTESHSTVKSIEYSDARVVVTFNSHVTQKTIDDASIEMLTAGVFGNVSTRSNKTMVIRLSDSAGVVRPLTNSCSFTIKLHS